MKILLKLLFAFMVAGLVGTTAWAQTNPSTAASSPTSTASVVANTSSTATGTQIAALSTPTLQIQLPPVALPRLASIRIRIDDNTIEKEKAFAKVQGLRDERDYAMHGLAALELKGKVSGHELGKVGDAVNAVNKVCAIGTDYIQLRLKKNSSWQFGLSMLSGLFGAATAAAPVISSAKVAGIAGLLTSNYKTEIAENGDTGHSNTELKKVLDDVRFELASGIQNYNRALLMATPDVASQLTQIRHLQAAVFEMHAACAYF